jgi:hypothetical protein
MICFTGSTGFITAQKNYTECNVSLCFTFPKEETITDWFIYLLTIYFYA